MVIRGSGVCVVIGSLAAAACGGSSNGATGAPSDAKPQIDAVIPTDGLIERDAGHTSDGGGIDAGRTPDAAADANVTVDAAPGATFVSNLPGTFLINQDPRFDMLSSNLLQRSSGGEVFQEWLGEFRNLGGTLLCLVDTTVNFRKSNGTLVVSFQASMFADAYTAPGIPRSIACTAPGHIATLYDNGFVPTAADLTGVTEIEVTFTPFPVPDASPAQEAPAIATRPARNAFGDISVSGTLTGRAGTIDDMLYSAFPRGDSPLVLGFLTDLSPSSVTLSAGDVYAFTTLVGLPTAFTNYREYVDFAIATPAPAASPQAAAAVLAETTRVHQRQRERAVRASTALHRAH